MRLAILDLYDNTPNQGMRCIKDIVRQYEDHYDWQVFDVRGKSEVPDMSFDIFISSGGPGSPHDGDGVWDALYYDWLDNLWQWNQVTDGPKKHAFFICHSFQMACKYFKVGQVTKRKSKSFGTFPIHMTDVGASDPLFSGLPNPLWGADFRDWQVIQPNIVQLERLGAEITALEKIRPHVPLERAIMAIRFSPEIFGVQFHPEADPDGMLEHFLDSERRKMIVSEHGKKKYLQMINDLHDGDKIQLTHNVIIPMFLRRSIKSLQNTPVLV